jgi:thiol-disulfide isomerase/thioredoxin
MTKIGRLSIKSVLDVGASIAVIILSILVGYRYFFDKKIDQPTSPHDPSFLSMPFSALQTGSALGKDPTIVLSLSSQCGFCTKSMPAIKQLEKTARQKGWCIAAVFAESEQTARAYLTAHQIHPDEILANQKTPLVGMTPIFLSVDNGKVQKQHLGALNAGDEFLSSVSLPRGKCKR